MSCTRCVDKFCTYKVPIFKHFNCQEVEELLKVIEHKEYKKGDILFNEGELADTLYIINEGKLKIFSYTKPEMSLKVLEVVSQRLVHLESLALVLSDNDTDAKLAYLLVDLANHYGIKMGSKIVVNLPFTREDMANYTGLTRETISRKLNMFSEKGIIKIIGHKKIEILDLKYLNELI